MLAPLADNGGPTWTHALLPGSPAIDTGTGWLCPATDQHGVPRPAGAQDDVGAYEFEGQPMSIPTFFLVVTNTPGAGNFNFRQNGNCRSGPGTAYGILSSAVAGAVAPVDGRNAAGDWYRLRMPGDILCWVRTSLGTFDGDPAGLPVRESPPTPTWTPVIPTATEPVRCASFGSKDACEAQPGCDWVVPPAGGPGSCK